MAKSSWLTPLENSKDTAQILQVKQCQCDLRCDTNCYLGTYPINGIYTQAQKIVYNMVLNAQTQIAVIVSSSSYKTYQLSLETR